MKSPILHERINHVCIWYKNHRPSAQLSLHVLFDARSSQQGSTERHHRKGQNHSFENVLQRYHSNPRNTQRTTRLSSNAMEQNTISAQKKLSLCADALDDSNRKHYFTANQINKKI